MTKKITLILGAGASKPYGFPTGIELRNLLIRLDPENLLKQHDLILNSSYTTPHPLKLLPEDELRKIQHNLKTLERVGTRIGISRTSLTDSTNAKTDFAKVFKYSGTASIDTFLSHRSDYAEIGKMAIASAILDFECYCNLEAWDWYGLLWSEIRKCIEVQDGEISFKPIPIDIVTFNYDRSLEYFLWNAIQSTFNLSQETAFNLISQINIIHFYGSLGPIYGQDAIPFGGNNVKDASSNIRVIPYERSGQINQELSNDQTKAKQLIHQSNNAIVYMGFGFDDQNCNLLDLKGVPESISIHGTTMGLTAFEKKLVGRKYFKIQGQSGIDEFIKENYGCIELIRNKPIFTS